MEFGTVPLGTTCGAEECPRAILAEGEITEASTREFSQFLSSELRVPGLRAVVFLNSPGGNVESALKLGALLHQAGAAVVVGRPGFAATKPRARAKGAVNVAIIPGHCASACVYTLMGAQKRVVPLGARLGIHRMSARTAFRDPAGGQIETNRIFAGSAEIAALRAYVARVGGSQDLISLAESVPHDRIHYLSAHEVRRFNLGKPTL